MGSPAFAGGVFVAAELSVGAADRNGAKESWIAMRQQAAMRKNSCALEGNFRWAGRNRMIFMNYGLPVQRYPKGLMDPDELELFEVEQYESMPQRSPRRNSGVVKAFPFS